PAKCLLQSADLRRRRVADDPDLIARFESGARSAAVRIDGLDDDDAVHATKREVDPLARTSLSLKRNECADDDRHGRKTDKDLRKNGSAHVTTGVTVF